MNGFTRSTVFLLLAAAGCSGGSTDLTPSRKGPVVTGAGGAGTSTSPTASASVSTTGAGGAATTGSGGGGAGGSFPPLGPPIDAPKEQWTWVPFDDAFCANGSTTGLGIYPTAASKRLLIFLMGGGACWNQQNCTQVPISLYLNGYDGTAFATDPQRVLAVLDRNNQDNPFKDYNVVYLPYCTGDVFAGNNVANFGGQAFHFVGNQNVIAYLKRIVPSFPGLERVVLAGDSAGGFGAGFNWWRAQQAFGSTRVDLIDDSGPPIPAPYLSPTLSQAFVDAWRMDEAMPPGCALCKTRFDALFDYYGATMQGNRGALLSYTNDSVISLFFNTQQFNQGLVALAETDIAPTTNLRYFFVPGALHVVETSMTNATTAGTKLGDWLRAMENDDPSWASAGP